MKKVEVKKFNSKFKVIAMVLLLLLVIEIPLFLFVRKASVNQFEAALASGETNPAQPIDMSGTIYAYNCVLCVISICVQIVYWGSKLVSTDWKKFNFKKFFSKNWTCILLAVFMIWTSIGCIQAGMEAGAENYLKSHTEQDKDYNYYLDIANWSETDRMPNAGDRSWNGCVNLKDGYFSFMFYATVLLNILMLGVDSKDYKKWIIRALIISSLVSGLFAFLSLFRYSAFYGITYYDRATFNNRNHFGYYISVILVMTIGAFIKDKNLYFKGVSFINVLLYMVLLFTCDTFGAYLGVLCAIIFLFIITIINVVNKKDWKEFAQSMVCILLFVFMSFSYVSAKSGTYSTKGVQFDYGNVFMNFGNSTFQLSFNTMDSKLAEELQIKSKKIDGIDLYFGNQITKLDKKRDSFVVRNFKSLFGDIGKMFGYYKSNTSEQSGENKEFTKEDVQNMLNTISAKYPKVSGETLEEWQARQSKIDEEFAKFIKDNNIDLEKINGGSSTTNETTTDEENVSLDDLGLVGSGRAPVWIRSLDLMNQRPWFGWGLENMLNEFYTQYNISEGRTHNLVLQLGGTTGIPGVIMYLTATIFIFLKLVFDAKFREFSKKGKIIIGISYLIVAVVLNIIICKFTDKLLFNGLITAFVLSLLTFAIFIKKLHLRIKDWNSFEFIGGLVFVSYMVSSLFGNSAFYTSPYFMIFLGMITFEVLNKKSKFNEELVEKK